VSACACVRCSCACVCVRVFAWFHAHILRITAYATPRSLFRSNWLSLPLARSSRSDHLSRSLASASLVPYATILTEQYEAKVVCSVPANHFGKDFDYIQFQILDPDPAAFLLSVKP
jgi:hypothetical protein